MPRKMLFFVPSLCAVFVAANIAAGAMPTWQNTGTSVQGRPLQCVEIPGGPDRVMVIAGFRGTRNASIQVAESLARHASEQAGLGNCSSILIVRDANPDGRALRTPNNARGVDLDRNFASSDWRKIPIGHQWLGGRQPTSEPETLWLTRLVTSWQPTCVVVLVDDAQKGWARTLGADPAWQSSLATMTALPWVESSLAVPSGSLASWVALDLKLPTLLINVPAVERAEDFWNAQKPLLSNIIQNANISSEAVVRIQNKANPLTSTSRPKRRLVDVLWPQESSAPGLAQSPTNESSVRHTISNRLSIEPIAGGPHSGQRIYRLPPAEQTAPLSAPAVQRLPTGAPSAQHQTLPHRPIPIWVDPNGR